MKFYHKAGAIKKILLILMAVATFILVIIRAFLGIEITDEVLTISESCLVLNGATPFWDNWVVSGVAFLTLPFAGIYHFFNPSMEGLFLFYRFSFFLIKLLFF